MTLTTTPLQAAQHTSAVAPGLSLPEASERSGYGVSTLRRHIKDGRLKAVKAKGRIFVRLSDLDAFAEPEPVQPSEASLQEWARRMAAKAPAMRPEQRQIILAAFSSALGEN
jgi:hypothetical protein